MPDGSLLRAWIESLVELPVCLKSTLKHGVALLLEQTEQLVHVLSTRAKIHGVDTEPRLSFSVAWSRSEIFALLHPP
jgi:hypothetical protein